jgi:hypothetical protein
MPSTPVSRRQFGLVFAAGTAAFVLILTGLIGYQPPVHFNPAEATWRTGRWTGGVIWSQVAAGVACLVVACVQFTRVNRRLFPRAERLSFPRGSSRE